VIAGLILAAGAGTRYGQPKAPVEIDGERLIDRSVRLLRGVPCDPIVAVLGAWRGTVPGAITVMNDDWPSGMGSSLRVGLTYLQEETDATDVLITLVDLPGLTTTAMQRIAATNADIVQATFDGAPSHPVRFARTHWPELRAQVTGDAGARAFLRERSDVVRIEIGDVADGSDMDVPGPADGQQGDGGTQNEDNAAGLDSGR
jgi:CTP:molybdopterin cytidylyltransferase MocA